MGSNCFGSIFKVTTWGESHGRAIGAVIDGCPAGVAITEDEINIEMRKRRGGMSSVTTERSEDDRVEILSGVYEGVTTGAPISLIIYNHDARKDSYSEASQLLRPSHATYTYLEKYGIFDPYGGGRASARETACRVASGAIAKKILKTLGISWITYVDEIAGITCPVAPQKGTSLSDHPIPCIDHPTAMLMEKKILEAKADGDSVGGVVQCVFYDVPKGLGDPMYEKLQAKLASAMLSIPACRGIEFGAGFSAKDMRGSEHNDPFILSEKGETLTAKNDAGGIIAGISSGMPIMFKVVMKPTSSIKKQQQTLTLNKEPVMYTLPEGARHDPCICVRAAFVVEAMAALVLVDSYLLHRVARID